MNKNFHYFALNYLNDWLNIDRPLFERLNSQCPETGRKALVGIANQYRVARCFLNKHEKGVKRLAPAYDLLQEQGAIRLKTKNSEIEAVNNLKCKFKKRYKKKNLSAASKFLWFKFRDPVVIYDSRAVRTLVTSGTLEQKLSDDYEAYYSAWREEYRSYEEQIEQCCKSLPKAKKDVAADLSKKEICEIVDKPWFRERVFDKFLYYNGAAN